MLCLVINMCGFTLTRSKLSHIQQPPHSHTRIPTPAFPRPHSHTRIPTPVFPSIATSIPDSPSRGTLFVLFFSHFPYSYTPFSLPQPPSPTGGSGSTG